MWKYVETNMKNITMAMDEQLLERARDLAHRRKTTLNALVRSLLANEVEQEDRIAWAREGMRQLIGNAPLDLGTGFKWDRDKIYAEREDRMLSRHEHSPLRGFGEES
jgi:Arc/MetJ-type ribon-helix-helix transcriptional regulator